MINFESKLGMVKPFQVTLNEIISSTSIKEYFRVMFTLNRNREKVRRTNINSVGYVDVSRILEQVYDVI